MDTVQISGMEIPLLEPPQKEHRTLHWILYVLFKHPRFIATTFLVVSLPIVTAILLWPTKYLAVSKILIKPSRDFLNVSPTLGGGGSFGVSPSPEAINTEIQIIKSRELLERLAKEVPFPGGDETDKKRNTVWRLNATPIRASNLIAISLTGTNPLWVARAVNRAAELYFDQHLKIHETRGVEEFYDAQENKLRGDLTKAETALKEYQDKEKVVDAPQELGSTLSRLAAFETNLKTTEAAILEAQERIAILERQLREQREHVASGKTIADNPAYASINARILQLQLERNSLLQRYTEDDRLVRDKDKEIAELKNRLTAEIQRMVQGESVGLNPLHQGILASLLAERANLKALQARKNALLQQVGAYSALSGELKKKSYLYDRLQQELNARKEALALYKRKAEEARISQAMDERKFGNAALVEKAALPLPRAGLSPWIMYLLTVFGSMAIAVAGAFVMELVNTSVRNEADVEEQIGLPVLATIQYYPVTRG